MTTYALRAVAVKILDAETVEMVWFLDPEIVEKVNKSFMCFFHNNLSNTNTKDTFFWAPLYDIAFLRWYIESYIVIFKSYHDNFLVEDIFWGKYFKC